MSIETGHHLDMFKRLAPPPLPNMPFQILIWMGGGNRQLPSGVARGGGKRAKALPFGPP